MDRKLSMTMIKLIEALPVIQIITFAVLFSIVFINVFIFAGNNYGFRIILTA